MQQNKPNLKAAVTTKQHRHEKQRKECALSLPLWLRCVSMEALCISIHFLCRFNRIIKNEKEMLTQSSGLIYGADNRRQLQ